MIDAMARRRVPRADRRLMGRAGAAPKGPARREPPRMRAPGAVPGGDPLAHAPTPRPTHAPKRQPPSARGAGQLVNERAVPTLDLFSVFPDLPRAPRVRTARITHSAVTRRLR
jgi:hypothetical protein